MANKKGRCVKIKGFHFVDEKGTHSVDETYSLIQKAKESLRSVTGTIVLEADRSLQTAIRFLAIQDQGLPVLMLTPEEFANQDFQNYVYSVLGPAHLWARSAQLPILSGKGSVHPSLAKAAHCFIVKTSGTSGMKNKFVLHDTSLFLKKFSSIKPSFQKTLNFFPPDSIAGVETLLECMVQGTTLVNIPKVDPEVVTEILAKEKIDFLHATPTFLNLLLVSGKTDLTSVKTIAYGSEPAQKNVLDKFRSLKPSLKFTQIYGMSEIGLQKTETREDDPTWFRLDQNTNPTRVTDGTLEVKSQTPMITCLNNDRKVENGWFMTSDSVVEENSWIKVIGRSDDVINVAGKKFHPIQLEEILMNMDGIDDVMVTAEPHDLIGNAVIAKITSGKEEKSFRGELREYLEKNVPAWMRPQRIEFVPATGVSSRLKKRRKN